MANDDLQAEIKDLCKKLGEAPHSSVGSIPPPPPVLSDKQFARDLKCAQIASLSGEPHDNQPSIGTSSSVRGMPPPNTYTSFSSRGRVQVTPALSSSQVEQPADCKGKQRQPSPPQVEPPCPPMEDEITPGDLYADIPMTVNEPIVQGTMFPNFDGTEYLYRVLRLGQGNDSVRLLLFMRINNNLYAYGDEMIGKDVQGFLLYKRLALVSRRHHDWNVWLHELIEFLTVKGRYRALLEWAEVAPANGTPVPWEGEFTHSATLADVAAYLAANGVMYHDTDDALNNGGVKDPNTKAIINQMRATLNELLPVGEHHSLEWIDLQARVLGVLPENIVPYEVHPIEERDLFALEEFAKLAALYDLSHRARGEGSNAGGAVPIPASTLEEGEMEDDSRPM
ncbi:hypothetical protein EDC04DRAFT_2890578 [Pisolithus marmoratus]|nr:hypothetical protein EDC04DRAFT_2890578 [Pisolithus marmoratus]